MNTIKKLKQVYKISQVELAKTLNTTQQQISLYATGKRKLNEDQIREICKTYQVSADWLLGLTE